jgi:hypothetical protein
MESNDYKKVLIKDCVSFWHKPFIFLLHFLLLFWKFIFQLMNLPLLPLLPYLFLLCPQQWWRGEGGYSTVQPLPVGVGVLATVAARDENGT